MAHLYGISHVIRPTLLNKTCSINVIRPTLLNKSAVRFVSRFRPQAGWLEKPKSLLFHPENMMKHKEVLPIMIFTIMGFTTEVLWTIRLAFTRDDVIFLNKKYAHEQLETRSGPWYPPPVRKFFVFNQKYEHCKGAIAAIREAEGE